MIKIPMSASFFFFFFVFLFIFFFFYFVSMINLVLSILNISYLMIAELSHAWCACSGTPWIRKFPYLCIREILVVTCSHVDIRPSVRPLVRPHHKHTNICKRKTQSTGMATQMQLEIFLAGYSVATLVLWSRDSSELKQQQRQKGNGFRLVKQ